MRSVCWEHEKPKPAEASSPQCLSTSALLRGPQTKFCEREKLHSRLCDALVVVVALVLVYLPERRVVVLLALEHGEQTLRRKRRGNVVILI